MVEREPFDAGKSYERMADRVRVEISNLALRLMDDPDYKALSPVERIETFMAGGMTGVVGVCFASIMPRGRDEMMESIAAYLPLAAENAAGIMDAAEGRNG